MSTPFLIVAAVIGVGLLYVVVPVVAEAIWRFRGSRQLHCPEAKEPAEIGLDRAHAAVTAAFSRPDPRVAECSLWPEREDCRQDCVQDLK